MSRFFWTLTAVIIAGNGAAGLAVLAWIFNQAAGQPLLQAAAALVGFSDLCVTGSLTFLALGRAVGNK